MTMNLQLPVVAFSYQHEFLLVSATPPPHVTATATCLFPVLGSGMLSIFAFHLHREQKRRGFYSEDTAFVWNKSILSPEGILSSDHQERTLPNSAFCILIRGGMATEPKGVF